MAYIGQNAEGNFTTTNAKDRFSGDGSTTTFTLSQRGTENNVDVFVNNVRQEPGVAYNIEGNGTSLVFTAAPSTGTNNIYVVNRGPAELSASHPATQNLEAVDGTFTGNLTVDTDTLYVDGTNNRVGVGTDSPDTIAEIRGANPIVTIRDLETSSASAEATLRLAETGASDSLGSYWDIKSSGGKLEFIDNWNEGGGTGTRVTLDDSGNVGINNQNPNTKIDAIGSTTNGSGIVDTLRLRNTGTTIDDGARIQFTSGSSTSGAGIGSGGKAVNSADLRFYTGGNTERMSISSNGAVSIAASSGNGYLAVPQAYTGTTSSAVNMHILSSGVFLRSVSSGRYKTGVEDAEMSYAEELYNLRPVYYKSLGTFDNPNHGHWGFIAEEVAEIDPRLCLFKTTEPDLDDDGNVQYDDNGNVVETTLDEPVVEGVQYDRMIPLLLMLLKAEKDKVETLETKVATLETQNADFETRIAALEAN